jgi:signal transduction histidine kinase
MQILIADDNRISRHGVVLALKDKGFETIPVPDGAQAWEVLRRPHGPKLAILDWEMPGIDGVELCRKIRRGLEKRYVYVIVLTGRSDKEDAVAAINAGADDYVTKPFHMDELVARVNAGQRILRLEEELASLNAHLEQRVEERTAEVQRLLIQKENFINQLGHDLKTPLTPLVALLPMALKDARDPNLCKMLELAVENVNYMRGLVEKTLILAKMNATEHLPTFEPVDLTHVVDDAIRTFRLSARGKGLVLTNRLKQPVVIDGDPVNLRELLHNLLSNAVKYAGRDGRIVVEADVRDENVLLSVRDNGPGFPPEQAERIFEEFYKADASRHDRSSSGLGLSICRRIVERHGGRIWAESLGPGQGATFQALLPRRQAIPPAAGSSSSEETAAKKETPCAF